MHSIVHRKQTILLVLSLFVFSALLYGQEKTIKVWQNKIPGAIDNPSYNSETIYVDGNKPRLTKVTDPTLDFYPAEKSNGTATSIE